MALFCSCESWLLAEKDLGEIPSNDQCPFEHSDQLGMHNTSECHEAVTCNESEQLHSVKNGSEMEADTDVIASLIKSEDSNLFRQHFGSLSTTHKVSNVACNYM